MHHASLSLCITHQYSGSLSTVPQSLSKNNAMDGFALAWAKTNLNCHPNTLLTCAMGTLSPFVVRRGFDCPGPAQLVEPLVLTNQWPSLNIDPNVWSHHPLLSMCFPTAHCTIRLSQCLVNMIWNMMHSLNTVISGPDIYESVFEISPIVWLWGFFQCWFFFSRPRLVLEAVVRHTGYIFSHPIIVSTIVIT